MIVKDSNVILAGEFFKQRSFERAKEDFVSRANRFSKAIGDDMLNDLAKVVSRFREEDIIKIFEMNQLMLDTSVTLERSGMTLCQMIREEG